MPGRDPHAARDRQLANLFEGVPDLVARFDRRLRHLCVNRRVEQATGRPAEEFVGRTNRDLGMPADLVDYWEAGMRAAFDTGRPGELGFSFPSPDRTRHFEARLLPERGPDGAVDTLLVVTRDVTDRKEIEDALRASEARFRLLVENARDVVFRFEYGPPPRYAYVSPAVEVLTGHPPAAFYADPAMGLAVVHPDDRPRLAALMAGDQDPPPGAMEFRFVRRDGRVVWTEQRSRVERDAAGRPLAAEGVVRDVTDRHLADEAVRAALDRAEAALARVRQLEAVLPMCSYCRRIRDGQAWVGLEAYLDRHTGTRVSHGICPGCFAAEVQPQLDRLGPEGGG